MAREWPANHYTASELSEVCHEIETIQRSFVQHYMNWNELSKCESANRLRALLRKRAQLEKDLVED